MMTISLWKRLGFNYNNNFANDDKIDFKENKA